MGSPSTTAGCRIGRQRDALVGERAGERRRLRAGDGGEVDGLGVEQQAGALGLGERREVVEQAGEAQRLVVHRREVGLLVLQDAVLRRLDAREDAHHRRAQLVRQVGDALLAQALLLLQCLGEAVEGVGDGRDLVVAGLRDAHVQVAGAHGVGAGADAPQRPRERHREVQGDQHGDGRGDDAGHQVHAQELPAQLDLLAGEQPAVVAAHDHGADLLVAHHDRRRRRRALLHGRRGRMREDELAARVVQVHGEEVDLGQVVQGLDALPGPAAVLGDDRRHVAEVGGGVVQPGARGGLEVRGEADARVDGGHDRAQQGHGDERDHEAGAQAPSPAAVAHSFASR